MPEIIFLFVFSGAGPDLLRHRSALARAAENKKKKSRTVRMFL
jgi:hypothetical protein